MPDLLTKRAYKKLLEASRTRLGKQRKPSHVDAGEAKLPRAITRKMQGKP
jgi:hypothetical protein